MVKLSPLRAFLCFWVAVALPACSDPPPATAASSGGDASSADSGGGAVTTDTSQLADSVKAAEDGGGADSAVADTPADTAANVDTGTVSAADSLPDTPVDSMADSVADSVSDAGSDIVADPVADTVADTVPDAGGVADAGTDLDAAAETVFDAAADTALGPDTGSVAEPPADAGAPADVDAAADASAPADSEVVADGAVDSAADVSADTAADTAAPAQIGCSDGAREGFLDKTKYPLVAGCTGAWDIPGIHKGAPACGRKAGNTGSNAAGKGCNVEDLCADSWHVCYGAKDLKERNPLGCAGILDDGGQSPAFFLARSSSTGAFNCSQDSTKFGDPGTSNDLFGCGDLGCGIDFKTYPTCDPLNRASHDICKGLRNDLGCGDWCSHLGKFAGQKNTWDCGKNTTNEANVVVKVDPLVQGGVLCCADFLKTP